MAEFYLQSPKNKGQPFTSIMSQLKFHLEHRSQGQKKMDNISKTGHKIFMKLSL